MFCKFIGGEQHGKLLDIAVCADGLPPACVEWIDEENPTTFEIETYMYTRKTHIDANGNQTFEYHTEHPTE